jgi:hypothetical protein
MKTSKKPIKEKSIKKLKKDFLVKIKEIQKEQRKIFSDFQKKIDLKKAEKISKKIKK